MKRFILAFVLLFGVAAATDYPVTVTDDLGREVTLQAAPQRIITMIPSHTETVCALDACDLLVGVDQFSNFPVGVEDLPDFGSAFSPNIEAIVNAEPDLVLVDESSGIAATLAELGLVVYAGTPQTYEDVFVTFQTIGLLIDRETEAAVLSGTVRGEVQAVEELVADRPRPTVFYELDDTPYSVGPDSFIGVLLRKAGGDNIIEPGMGDFPQVDPEFVVAQDPEIILLSDAPYGVTAASVAERPGWDTIEAVQQGNVIELEQNEVDAINRPGPRIAEAVKLLARIFHPGVF